MVEGLAPPAAAVAALGPAAAALDPAVAAYMCVRGAGRARPRGGARRRPRSGAGAQVEAGRLMVFAAAKRVVGRSSEDFCGYRITCRLVVLIWLCLFLIAGRGWTNGGRCLYKPAPATVCTGDEVDACGLRLETWALPSFPLRGKITFLLMSWQ